MNFKLNTQEQDAILYALTFTLSNHVVSPRPSQDTLNNLHNMLDVFKIEEDKRYGLHSGTYQYNKARVESMSNRIEELEAHLEILEKQLELYHGK